MKANKNSSEHEISPLTGWRLVRAKLFLFVVSMFRWMTLGARGVLVDGTKVLLIRHTYVSGWQFPGGGVDAGETFESTMRREVLEETGYEILGKAHMHGVFLNNQVSRRDHVALFVQREFVQVAPFKPNREIAEIGWFDVNDLPKDINRSARQRISEIFEDQDVSPNW